MTTLNKNLKTQSLNVLQEGKFLKAARDGNIEVLNRLVSFRFWFSKPVALHTLYSSSRVLIPRTSIVSTHKETRVFIVWLVIISKAAVLSSVS